MLDVYRSFYKFNSAPFRLSPDHKFSYVHSSYANAKAYLEYAISQGEGFIAITGEPGAGKTTLICGLLAELDKTRLNVATLKNLQLDPENLIGMVVKEFGLRVENKSKSCLLLDLEQFLKKQFLRGQRAVLIIDEAQGLSPGSLEELRLLSNLQYGDCLLLQVFLVGQDTLMDTIRSPDMEHLRQRLIASSHLDRLSLEETVAYIEHRLCYAGWQGAPAISEDALRMIHKYSLGVPRRINLICHRLFLYGGLNQKDKLVGTDAQIVVGELSRESMLNQNVPEESDELVTGLEGDSTADLSLPRARSHTHIKECNQIPSSPAPESEPLIVHSPLQPPSATPKKEECNDRAPIRENRLAQGCTDTGSASMPGEPDIASRWKKYRLGVVAPVLLAVLVLVTAIETDFKYHQSNFISSALIEDGNQSPAVATQYTELTDDLTASTYHNPERRNSETDKSGANSHYSPSVTVASYSANSLQADRDKSGKSNRATLIADNLNEQRLTPDDSNVMASDIGNKRWPQQEVERKSAELTSDDLERVDDQVVTVAARIEAEHRRLHNEAKQRFNRRVLKEGGLAGLPAAD